MIPLLLGGDAVAILVAVRRSQRRHVAAAGPARNAEPEPEPQIDAIMQELEPDPGDPVQTLDSMIPLHLEDLGVDAVTTAEAEAERELALIESDLDDRAIELDTPAETDADARASAEHDAGDLLRRAHPAGDRSRAARR